MAKKKATKYKGIRYVEHKTRKHGVRSDRYFYIRYSLNGKSKEEGWGWESEGFTAKKAFVEREKIMHDIKIGAEVVTLKERRAEAERLRAEKLAIADAEARGSITFDTFFNDVYLPGEQGHKKMTSIRTETNLYRGWIRSTIGDLPFNKISHFHLEKIRRNLISKGRSLRTVQYCYSIVRQVFSQAGKHGVFEGQHPVKGTRRLKVNNKRVRFLSHAEAGKLLAMLKERSQQTHDLALVSLFCGARRGELFKLDWSDIDLTNGLISFRNTKNGESRVVHMPEQVMEMFSAYSKGKGNQPVFLDRNGNRATCIRSTFNKVIEELGLNDGVQDRLQKVVFHPMRHSYGSWLAQAGIELYTIQKLLGHKKLEMTMRYAHLSPDSFAKAGAVLSGISMDPTAEKVVNLNK